MPRLRRRGLHFYCATDPDSDRLGRSILVLRLFPPYKRNTADYLIGVDAIDLELSENDPNPSRNAKEMDFDIMIASTRSL